MLDIYKASAGSGKTFALTLEYFRIIFQMPLEYKNVLAVTFTNKATEEMKSRIINELHNLAEGVPSDYGRILQKELGLDNKQLKNKASLLRTLLLHDYGRISVTTIDRFFQRIIKAFTRELGIFPGYNVELDSDFVLMKAVDKLMQTVKEHPELKNWIRELMNNSVEGGKSWSIKSKIADLGAELFRENYMLFNKHVLDKFSDKHFLKAYRDFLAEVIDTYESSLSSIATSALEVIRGDGLELADFKSGKSGCASWFYKLAAGNFGAPTATVRKGAEEPDSWVTQKSVHKARIEGIRPQLMQYLQEALKVYDTQNSHYLSALQLSGNLYQLGILNDLYREVRAYCNEKGVMLLSDTTHVLNLLIANNDTSFLFEKCGNYYKHLMIDEFQDTSAMQWKNFCPLVANSLAEGSKTMIVGDVKQSIYRWRNGEWGLLAKGVEEQFKTWGVNNIVLGDNWRSAHEVVEFNNDFFEVATHVLTDLYIKDAGEGDSRVGIIGEAYRDLRQTPRKKKNGYIDICFGPEKKEEEGNRIIMDGIVDIIQDIRNRGGRLKEIVILVRGGKEGAFVADYLITYNKTTAAPIHFISNDSLYVWSSPCVQFIVSVLRYMAEPYDMVIRATMLYSYHTFIDGDSSDPSLDTLFQHVAEEDSFILSGMDFNFENASASSYSLYEAIETIIDAFSLKTKEEEVPYLIAFQDIIYEYEANNSNSITLFLEWWEKEQNKRVLSTSEEVDAVRILTIHKSKGLEFEYVLLPFCSWELDSVRPVRRIWCSNNEQGFNALDYAPLNYSSKLADTIFREDYFDEHLKAYIDSLNLLYVALTRAKTELYLRPFTPKKNKDGSISVSDIGAFVYQVLEEMDAGLDQTGQVRIGEKRSLEKGKESANPSFSLEHYPVWEPGERISVKYLFRDYTEPQEAGLSAIDEGKLLHEIFKSIRYVDEVEQAVGKAYLGGLIKRDEKEKYVAKISTFLGVPQASEWFAPSCKVMNERDILFPGGAKARPDRVVEREGKIYVVDYKFGQSEENKYLKQVRYYCKALRDMGHPRVEGYIWYVKLGKIVQI